ncbi:MAG TPA: cytochrome B [Sulfurospirillum arcachonense]|nr:cytochrome B [Sulfurospirillum arcachonense]
MENGMTKSYIWPVANRVSHVLLMVFFTLSYILADFDRYLSLHVAFGLALGVVFLFRIVWGFIGPKHSKFKDFNFNLYDLKNYLFSIFVKTKEYAGHNPASSYAIVAMIVVAFLTIVSGLFAYGIEENRGVLSFLHQSFFRDMEVFEDIHEFFANLFLAIIVLHVAGSLVDRFIKKSDAIDSMISGYKVLSSKVDIKVNLAQKLFGIIWIVVSLFSLYYLIFTKGNIFIASSYVKQDYTVLHKDFSEECGSCHITYPPYLLSKNSWISMMKNLENHFDDDASLDEVTNQSILSFLMHNSAENSTHKSALKILKSLKDNNSTIAITKTPYWRKKHDEIEKSVFASNEVKSRANCKACHENIENGLLEYDLINIPDIKG